MIKLDGPPDPIQVVEVPLDGPDGPEWLRLQSYLTDEIDQALQDRKPREKNWEIWAKQWNARGEKKGPGDAEIDMPSTFKIIRQETGKVVAQLYKAEKFFIVEPANSTANDDYREWQRAVDYLWNRFDNLEFGVSAFRVARVFGYVVVKMGWTVEKERCLKWKDVTDPVVGRMMLNDPESPIVIAQEKALVEEEVTVWAGCRPEVIPIEDYIHPEYAIRQRHARWQAHRSWDTVEDVEDKIDQGLLPKNALEILGSPESLRPKTFALEQPDGEKPAPRKDRHFQNLEIYLDWKIDKSGKRKSCIAYYEHSKKKLLRVTRNWLNEYRVPIEVWTAEERDDGIPGVSGAFRAEPLHRAITASVRQRLDAGMLANAILLFTNNKDILGNFPGGRIQPGIWFTNADVMKELIQFKISAPEFHQLENLEQMFNQELMLIFGLNEPDYGGEVADRPTAGGTLKVIEMGGLPADMVRESYRRFLARVMKHMLARNRQFFPAGMDIWLTKQTDKGLEAFNDFLKWPEGVIENDIVIKTSVSSATINKTLEAQKKMALSDKLPELFGFALKLGEQAQDPSPVGFMAEKMLRAYLSILQRTIEELGADELVPILSGVMDAMDAGRNAARALKEANDEIAKLQADNQKMAQFGAVLSGGAGLGPEGPGGAGIGSEMGAAPPLATGPPGPGMEGIGGVQSPVV